MVSTADMFIGEFVGTAVLLLLGGGVCATVNLKNTKGNGGGNGGFWLLINIGWGLAVFTGVIVAHNTGGHLNPAVTIAQFVAGNNFAEGVEPTIGNLAIYIVAQLLGAIVGALLMWLVYKDHFDHTEDPGAILGTFATGPQYRNYGMNVYAEALGTFILLTFVMIGGVPAELGPLPVALIIIVIGTGLGSITGYAINPVRDFGPRLVHQLVPIKHKGDSDWSYSWVPIVGPIIGAVVAALLIPALGLPA